MFWTQGLNPEQAKAVQHNFGPLLILAGAGSGKTTVLVSRTGRLISEKVAQADEICVMTFTNKAARELKHRVAHKLGDIGNKIWAGTFHSFGLQLLRKNHKKAGLPSHFGIVDTSDCQSIIKELLKDVKVTGKDRFDVDRLLDIINRKRNKTYSENEAFDEYDELAAVLHPKFEKKLQVLGVVDFEGLLLNPIRLFQDEPEILAHMQNYFSQVMVDEFQDTNHTQMQLIRMLSAKHLNLTVVGDDDQSIYGWRGAQVKNILDFPKEYKNCEVIKLERNYRSCPKILDLANQVISKNQDRHGKTLKPTKAISASTSPELFVLEKEDDECEFVAQEIRNFLNKGFEHKDIAVLYRSNTQGGLIESALRRFQIPYSISGGTSIFDRKEAKDVLAYLKFALFPNEVSLRRIINMPSRGIGDTTIEKMNEYADANKKTFLQAFYQRQSLGITQKTLESMNDFDGFVKSLTDKILNGAGTISENFVRAFIDLGYKSFLFQSHSDPHSAEKKWVVVEIVGRILEHFILKRNRSNDSLKEFIDMMTLRDDDKDEVANEVQLMTLHASKGLEFPVVILAGVEEDLLPHKTLGSDISEERRLFYVGITRAKQKLIMSRCQSRLRHGVVRPVSLSRFLLELPNGLYTEYQGYRPVSGEERDNLVQSFLANLNSKLGAN